MKKRLLLAALAAALVMVNCYAQKVGLSTRVGIITLKTIKAINETNRGVYIKPWVGSRVPVIYTPPTPITPSTSSLNAIRESDVITRRMIEYSKQNIKLLEEMDQLMWTSRLEVNSLNRRFSEDIYRDLKAIPDIELISSSSSRIVVRIAANTTENIPYVSFMSCIDSAAGNNQANPMTGASVMVEMARCLAYNPDIKHGDIYLFFVNEYEDDDVYELNESEGLPDIIIRTASPVSMLSLSNAYSDVCVGNTIYKWVSNQELSKVIFDCVMLVAGKPSRYQ